MNYLRVFIMCSVGLFLMSFHEYYMGFAEMQYNKDTRQFEISVTVIGHDFEQYLEEKGVNIPPLESCIGQVIHLQKIEKEIKNGFEVRVEDEQLQLDLIGMQVNKKDEASFFFTSREMDKPKSATVRFDLMMNYFLKQQNKLTVFTEGGKSFYAFLKSRPERKIEL